MNGFVTKKVQGVKQILKERKDELFKLKIRLMVTMPRLNHVPADQATEWINKTCKMQNGIIGITRNDQARDRFCVTWSERSQISEDTRHLFGLEDDKEESLFTRFDSLASRRVQDADDVAKLVQQLNKYDVFRVHAALLDPAFAEDDGVAIDIPLVSLATKDIAPSDVVNDLLTAEDI